MPDIAALHAASAILSETVDRLSAGEDPAALKPNDLTVYQAVLVAERELLSFWQEAGTEARKVAIRGAWGREPVETTSLM